MPVLLLRKVCSYGYKSFLIFPTTTIPALHSCAQSKVGHTELAVEWQQHLKRYPLPIFFPCNWPGETSKESSRSCMSKALSECKHENKRRKSSLVTVHKLQAAVGHKGARAFSADTLSPRRPSPLHVYINTPFTYLQKNHCTLSPSRGGKRKSLLNSLIFFRLMELADSYLFSYLTDTENAKASTMVQKKYFAPV